MFGSRIRIRIKLKSLNQGAVLQSQKPDMDPYQSRKAVDARDGAIETHPGALEAHNGAEKAHRGVLGSCEDLKASHFDEDPNPHQSKTSDPNPDSDLHYCEKPDPDRIKVMRIRKTGSNQLKIVTWSRVQ